MTILRQYLISGNFSEAFNTMTQQLEGRELKLETGSRAGKIHAGMVETYNQLLVEMIDRSEEEIFRDQCRRQEDSVL